MEKTKKKRIKQAAALVCTFSVVGLLAAMPLLAKQDRNQNGPQASILSGAVQAGTINTEVIGGGTLTAEDAVSISVPAAVKLTEYLVSDGEVVAEGTPIAKADRVTVMQAITQVQETLDYLSEQVEKAGEVVSEEAVPALAGGIVKILYAEEGELVQNVMLEHGALAVLSLDGLMAVDLETDANLSVGSAVTVTLSDGTETSGKVAFNLAGSMTVTVEDDAYAVGETVQIAADGSSIGSGALYIYSPWNAAAYTGTVKALKVSEGDKLDAGDALMVLSDVGYSAAYRQLVGQRQQYEELMLELFELYQTETVTAPCDGVVSGVSEGSVQLLADNGQGFVVSFLANSPNGDDETLYANYAAKITAIADNGWVMNVNPQAVPVADYTQLSGVPTDTSLMTQTVLHTKTELPVFERKDGAWVQVDCTAIGVGDILLFASDAQGDLVWGVLVQKAAQQPTQPDKPDNQGGETQPGNPDGQGGESQPSNPGGQGGENQPSNPGGQGSFGYPSSGSGAGGFGSFGGITEQEPQFELYSMDMAQIAAVTPQNEVTMEITVDELDVKTLQIGMEAQVRIDALGGEKHTATITEVGNVGINNGGFSKFTVKLTMARSENMLSGMNATAVIVLDTISDVLTIPADALVENGNETLVYTGYDAENEALLNPVTIKTGISDGETVEILEGLENGQTYYYAYYDTLEISFTPDFGGRGFFR